MYAVKCCDSVFFTYVLEYLSTSGPAGRALAL